MGLSKKINDLKMTKTWAEIKMEGLNNSWGQWFLKNKIKSIETKILDLEEQIITLETLLNIGQNSKLIMTTPTVVNELEPQLRSLGFYLIKRDIVNGQFEHTYTID